MQKETQELNGGWLKLEQKDTIESIVFAHQLHGFSCNKMIGFFFIVELSQAVQFMGIYSNKQNSCFFSGDTKYLNGSKICEQRTFAWANSTERFFTVETLVTWAIWVWVKI